MASPNADSSTLRDALVKHGKLHDAAVEIAAEGGVVVTRGAARVQVLPEAAFAREPALVRAAIDAAAGVLLLGDPPAILLDVLLGDAPVAVLPDSVSDEALGLAVHGLLERLELRALAKSRDSQLTRYRYERGELVEIAQAITRERDIDRLLNLILEKSRYVTGADAGSIYVIDGAEDDPNGRRLHFKLSQNDSMVYESREFVMPVSMESIAGAAVVTKQNINVADVYVADADESLPYGFDESFDKRTGYRTVSMLCVPMISAQDEVIGVIQLINKKKNPRERLRKPEDFSAQAIPFDARQLQIRVGKARTRGDRQPQHLPRGASIPEDPVDLSQNHAHLGEWFATPRIGAGLAAVARRLFVPREAHPPRRLVVAHPDGDLQHRRPRAPDRRAALSGALQVLQPAQTVARPGMEDAHLE